MEANELYLQMLLCERRPGRFVQIMNSIAALGLEAGHQRHLPGSHESLVLNVFHAGVDLKLDG